MFGGGGFLAFVVQFEAGTAMVAPAQLGNVVGKAMQDADGLLKLRGNFSVPAGDGGGVSGGDHGGQVSKKSPEIIIRNLECALRN